MVLSLHSTFLVIQVMRLWSAESCKCLDEYFLVDKAPLIDFDFDEGKVSSRYYNFYCILDGKISYIIKLNLYILFNFS